MLKYEKLATRARINSSYSSLSDPSTCSKLVLLGPVQLQWQRCSCVPCSSWFPSSVPTQKGPAYARSCLNYSRAIKSVLKAQKQNDVEIWILSRETKNAQVAAAAGSEAGAGGRTHDFNGITSIHHFSDFSKKHSFDTKWFEIASPISLFWHMCFKLSLFVALTPVQQLKVLT